MHTDTAFVVLSCDKYSDLWPIFICFFEKNWSDCPYDKFFITNNLEVKTNSFSSIKLGNDETWSIGLLKSLTILEEKYKYVFITLEDLFILKVVDTSYINKSIELFKESDGNYLRFYTKRKPHSKFNEYFGILEKGVPYRQNCVYSFWKIETLKQIISPQENAWEFEKLGTKRSETMAGFYCSTKNCFTISNSIVKGKWVPKELELIKKQIPNFVPQRNILSARDSKRLYMQELYFNIFFKYVPSALQKPLLRIFNK